MSLIEPSHFRPCPWLTNAHAQTIWPAVMRPHPRLPWQRERLELEDGDFLDLDWVPAGSEKLVILSHGLEGGSTRKYMAGMASAFRAEGWDTLAWSFRGCSEEPNRLPRAYHSGASDDLAAIIRRVEQLGRHRIIGLVGFSLGANLTLKFLGELHNRPGRVQMGMAISVPCDLRAAAERMDQPNCRFYRMRFIRSMRSRMAAKRLRFGSVIPCDSAAPCETFREFDDRFTAPLHGFRDAQDYWEQCSAVRFLPSIRVPTLILNAWDDPFLAPACYPVEIARDHPWVHLETPRRGGHVGFVSRLRFPTRYWAEVRATEFFRQMEGFALPQSNA